MFRLRSSLLLPRRRAATMVALLLVAQLALFAHAVGHDYAHDADQSHVVCGLCIAAHHLGHGLAPASIELPRAALGTLAARPRSLVDVLLSRAPFQARAPPRPTPVLVHLIHLAASRTRRALTVFDLPVCGLNPRRYRSS